MAEARTLDAYPPLAPLRRGPGVQLELLLKDFAHFIDSDVALLVPGTRSEQLLAASDGDLLAAKGPRPAMSDDVNR